MIKVLYVEDHEAQRDILIQMLEQQGYKVDVACSGEEGMKKAREWHPDVVLMDIYLPGRIDGFEAIRQLRDSSDTEDIPIIVISAYGSKPHKEKARKAGVEHYTKPVPIDMLKEAIERLVKGRDAAKSKSSTRD